MTTILDIDGPLTPTHLEAMASRLREAMRRDRAHEAWPLWEDVSANPTLQFKQVPPRGRNRRGHGTESKLGTKETYPSLGAPTERSRRCNSRQQS